MKNRSPRDILYKSQLGSIQRKYRRSIDAVAAGRDVVSPVDRRSCAKTETGPAGVHVQVFECDEIRLPGACRKKGSAPGKPGIASELDVVPAGSSDLGRDGQAPGGGVGGRGHELAIEID